MLIKSSGVIASATESTLKSKCSNIGKKDVYSPNITNLSGVSNALSIFADVNVILQSYKSCLDKDAAHISAMGKHFSEADEALANKF